MPATTADAPPSLFDLDELPTPAAPRRLFTGLFPDAAVLAAIDAARRHWPGVPQGRLHPVPERLHLTLQCFHRVSVSSERAWLQSLRSLRFDPFEIVLDRAEPWRTDKDLIVVLRPAPSAALAALHRATAQLARRAGLYADTQGFRPHLTTLRHALSTGPMPLRQPIRWTVRGVDLICSELRPRPLRYHPLGRFPA
ncbi:MAG: 2'-5' RNA ligase family protein [Ottowia sp.]|uniref:2'-5' RNA ligase family protein n=1 Tax=Ottowia sp. TaxID=1898956 RepID=UPI0039E5CD6E